MRYLFFILLCFLSFQLQSQNICSNPGFETNSTCPNTLGQINYATGWITPSTGSSDYFACSFHLIGSNGGTPASGLGVAGYWLYSGWSASIPYSEHVRGTLSPAMVIGQTYSVSFKCLYYNSGLSNGPNGCWDMGAYFCSGAGCNWATYNCPPMAPHVSASSAPINKVSYVTYTFTYVATSAFTNVVIGPFCNALTASCTASQANYGNLDDVVISPALPINVYTFEGKATPKGNQLHWAMGNTEGATQIEVERQVGENAFQTLSEVSVNQTTYTDEHPNLGKNYYRLKIIDKDGGIRLSNIIEITNESLECVCQPIYVDAHTVALDYVANQSTTLMYQLVDMSGKVVYRQNQSVNAGSVRLSVDMTNFNSGMYILQLVDVENKVQLNRKVTHF